MILRLLLQSFRTNLSKVGPTSTMARSLRVLRHGLKATPQLRNVLESPSAQQHQKFADFNDNFFVISDRHYLCQTLTMQERLKSAEYHYGFVDKNFDPAIKSVLGTSGYPLWASTVNDHHFAINLMYGNDNMYEGGLSVVFFVDQQRVGVMSFSIIDGAMLGASAGPSVILCRNQTTSDRWYQKPLQDAFKQIALPYMMIASVAGVARALGKSDFFAVHERAHPAVKEGTSEGMQRSYSEFWGKYGAVVQREGLMKIALPLESTPLDQVSSNHRRRAKARREVMTQVSDTSAETLCAHMHFKPPKLPPTAENAASVVSDGTARTALLAAPMTLQLALAAEWLCNQQATSIGTPVVDASAQVIRSLIAG